MAAARPYRPNSLKPVICLAASLVMHPGSVIPPSPPPPFLPSSLDTERKASACHPHGPPCSPKNFSTGQTRQGLAGCEPRCPSTAHEGQYLSLHACRRLPCPAPSLSPLPSGQADSSRLRPKGPRPPRAAAPHVSRPFHGPMDGQGRHGGQGARPWLSSVGRRRPSFACHASSPTAW